jgi:hypothetical protein
VATTAITAGGSGIVTILYDGSAEQWLGVDHTVTAYLDWLGEDISQGLKVFICYFPEDNKWRVIAAECEPEPALAPPGHGDFIEASTTQTQAAATSMSYAVRPGDRPERHGQHPKSLAEHGREVYASRQQRTLRHWCKDDGRVLGAQTRQVDA